MTKTPRYLCIHGHFYQPPRENPWLEVVEEQPSAAPFHDWNARVTAECYGPNAAARILDAKGRIRRMANNYEQLSFNFGPTLLSWMEKEAPDLYASILGADAISRRKRGGFGNAVAQVYNHAIMPLASTHDQRTQVRWGILDFQRRFGRMPEGMWLAETAADTRALQALAAEGIRYTILAPHQARAFRPLGKEGPWTDLQGAEIDPTRPYLCRLPDGREIVLFFYDGPISRSIAFEGALQSGDRLLARIRQGFSDTRTWPQLLTVAVDGETFGHHSRFGEMALAWALERLRDSDDIRLTNFAEFLSNHQPEFEVKLREDTSWSCAHGIERWRDDCGCTTGGKPGWNQKWRRPLREAVDELKAELDQAFEGCGVFKDPWAARDEYLSVLLDDTPETRLAFLGRHLAQPHRARDHVLAWKALEMQRAGLLVSTSCAWFFDEVSRIEARQVLAYAARAVQLALEFDRNLEPALLERLREADSNLPEMLDGANVYVQHVRPLLVDLSRVVAHTAILTLAMDEPPPQRVYCHEVEFQDLVKERIGGTGIVVGRVRASNLLTMEEQNVSFCAVHFGGHDFHCAVRGVIDISSYEIVRERLLGHYRDQSMTMLIRTIDETFGLVFYTLRDLFQEERKRILYMVSDETLRRTEETYRRLYEENRQLMMFARDIGVPVLQGFRSASTFVLGMDIRRALKEPYSDAMFKRLERLAGEVRLWGADLEEQWVAWRLRARAEQAMSALLATPGDTAAIANVERLLDVADAFGVTLDLAGVQHRYDGLRQRIAGSAGDAPADATTGPGLTLMPAMRQRLRKLGGRLGFRVEDLSE